MLRNTLRLAIAKRGETMGAAGAAEAMGMCQPCKPDDSTLTYTGSCTIPVDGGGRLRLHHFVYQPLVGGEMEIPVLTSLEPPGPDRPEKKGDGADADAASPPLVRVHDQCITSEVFGSLKCDCREQLQLAIRRLSSERGAVIYMPQEGRGIGLGNKIRAYHLQETEGLDTVDANVALGLPEEARSYDAVPAILEHLKIGEIRLMTNNPMKMDSLRRLGVTVASREPCVVRPTPHSRAYFETKTRRMHHMLPTLSGAPDKGAAGVAIEGDAEKLVISTIPFDTSGMSKL
mmetsp:Transcript_3242/g.7927  ORF Transcript_3242/g.7927 Transcript_3242/m.7927 type:complete len:288 (-) Transcript_3242:124-987(-)